MRPVIQLAPHTLILFTLFAKSTSSNTTTAPTAAQPTSPAPPPAEPSGAPAAETDPHSENLHCFQCTGESTDPDDHCTDSGWISIPRGQRLGYRYLCPRGMDDFCMKTIERWESTQPGVPDKYRTRRGCSAKTRTR